MTLRIASTLPGDIQHWFREACPSLEIRQIAFTDIDQEARDASVLLATQTAMRDICARPSGWPYGLRWIHLLSAGLDGYPEWLFGDIAVTHSPGLSAAPVAEYCLAVILAAAKRMPEAWIGGCEQWRPGPSRLIAGQTLGIVGFGEVGKTLAAHALALGMDVQAVRRSPAPLLSGVRRAENVRTLFASSDHIVLALPATAETRGMVNHELLGQARPGAHLINVARGSIVDQQALLAALDSGRIDRASLDVTDPEPLPDGHPFYTHPRVFLTPHSAANDVHFVRRLADMFAENARRFISGAPLLHPARPPLINTE